MKNLIGICLVVGFLSAACSDDKVFPGKLSVSGVLKHHPQNVKSVQAYLGREFMVGDRPIIPTEKVPAEELMKFVGSKVTIKGDWNPGKKQELTGEELQLQRPVGYEDAMIGVGLKALEIIKAK